MTASASTETEARVFPAECPWPIGERVAVDSRTVAEDGLDFAGLVGTVELVQASDEDKPGGPTGPWMISVRLDADPEELYDFEAEELCAATGFMPGATDDQLFAKLAGHVMQYWRDMAEDEDETSVLATPLARKHFRIERRDDPAFDQVHFLDPSGFRAVYLSNIIGVK